MMTVKVLEHEGIYTAHRLVVRRGDDGKLYESVKRIALTFPPAVEEQWTEWVTKLTEDELDVGLQIFFDRWNFGTGTDGDGRVYMCLCDERDRRRLEDNPVTVINTTPARLRG